MSFRSKCRIVMKKSKKTRYLDNAAWLKSGSCDFENEKRQKTMKPKNSNAVLSKVKKSAALFFSTKKDRAKNKKTVVNNCLDSKKGSNIEPKKTIGSKTK